MHKYDVYMSETGGGAHFWIPPVKGQPPSYAIHICKISAKDRDAAKQELRNLLMSFIRSKLT